MASSSLLTAKRVCDYEDSGKRIAAVCQSQDPLVVLCEGAMMIVLAKLDVRSLAVCRLVSTDWLALASTDQLWEPKLKELWLGKAHIPRISKVPGISKMKATSLSIMDGKRNQITRDDLCDHTWDFRFTSRRGVNPNGAPMRRYFHPDGRLTAGELEDKAWGEYEASYTIVTKSNTRMGSLRAEEQYVRINWWPRVCDVMSDWWPHLSVAREPDWSWVLWDDLYRYTSIPDADKVNGTGPYAAAAAQIL